MTTRNLNPLFCPRSVAVIGGSARPGALGERVLANIVDGGFRDTVFAVNPKRVSREGVWWAKDIESLPEVPDLAVIVTPAATVPAIIAQLGAIGTRVAIVISAGFADAATKAALLEAARPYLMRIIGPNCLGVLLPHAGLNASFAPRHAAPGRLAFVSQSGALVTAMLDWAADRNIGFSSVVSVGDMADVDFGDLIDMLAHDQQTDAILLYVESVTNPAKFMSAARAATRIKPVVAIKAGRSPEAGKAAHSHTGALAGAYDVYAAAFERAGIVLVDTLTGLFDAAQLLSHPPLSTGNRLAIVTNGGGAGVLAADALGRTGGLLASLSSATIALLDQQMPPGWSRANPIDVVGDAHAERFAAATRAALADRHVDALLAIHCPTAVESGVDIAKAVVTALGDPDMPHQKPIIACWLGPCNTHEARATFDAAGVPVFDNLDDAVRGFGYVLQAAQARTALMRAPAQWVPCNGVADCARAQAMINNARRQGRTTLSAIETKALLAGYGVPVAQSRLAPTLADVAEACAAVPGPWAVKIVSPQLTHKSDVGGVALGLASFDDALAAARAMAGRIQRAHPEAVITGYEIETMINPATGHELLLGIADDPTFGPIIAFGAGGKAVELLADRALGLPPLDNLLARKMIDATRIARLLAGYRDVPPVDLAAVVRVIEALSAIATDLPDIVELDINPLLATAGGVLALDARARIADTPRTARLVIRPVPMQWAADLVTQSGLKIHVWPIRPDDEEALARLFDNVGPDDLRLRFPDGIKKVAQDKLAAMTQVDYRRATHFLAFTPDGTPVASAMLVCNPDYVRAELAILVHAGFRNRGISPVLLEHVIRYATAQGIQIIEPIESGENRAEIILEHEHGSMPAAPTETQSEVVSPPHIWP
ncbi:MAG: bifunctional acetate--CoA ligase family protein/GNAT family N-acetyltransferase [Sphingomonas sp.]|jgi:acetyltransferase